MATPERWRLLDGGSHVVAYTTGAAVSSAAMGNSTYGILLSTSQNCHIRISHAGTAATIAADWLLKNTDPGLFLGVAPGDIVSVIGDTASGNLYVAELTA